MSLIKQQGTTMNAQLVAGIEYQKPQVFLLQETGLGSAEFAGRTAYNSFDKSENEAVTQANISASDGSLNNFELYQLNGIESSNLLDSLAWVHHHHSVLELVNLTYLVKGTYRGVLQEHSRHRLQSLTVQSTRYTMTPILNAFIAASLSNDYKWFEDTLLSLDFLVVKDLAAKLEIKQLWDKLFYQIQAITPKQFYSLALSKGNIEFINNLQEGTATKAIFNALTSGKDKRNAGDSFKWIVTDNWKVDLVFNMNLRSLKNYLTLRDSGAAYFGIRLLAQAIKEATPSKYLDLIVK